MFSLKTTIGDFSFLAKPSWVHIAFAGVRLETLSLVVASILAVLSVFIMWHGPYKTSGFVTQTKSSANSPVTQTADSADSGSSARTPSGSSKTGSSNPSSNSAAANASPNSLSSQSSGASGGNITTSGGSPPAFVPAQVLNLTNWKLTLPIAKPNASTAMEVLQPQLASYSISPYFMVNTAGNAVIFQANVGGATTSGSNYPRSELREMTNGGTQPASWSTTLGTHTLVAKEAVNHLPIVKPQVVTAQVHGASSDIIEIIADGLRKNADGTFGICVRYNGSEQDACLDNNYIMGTVYNIQIVASGGHITIWYNGVQKFDFTNNSSGDYFKAGSYTQSNTSKGDAPDAYGEVDIYDLQVTHQ